MFASPSSTLPVLPIELKKEILKFCDPPTLAKTSSLSLEFLELSSPLLYRHIVFEGPEGLSKFLTLFATNRQPSLEPYLNLFLVVQSVTYMDIKGTPFLEVEEEYERAPTKPFFHPARLHLPPSPTPGHLPLQSLEILLPDSDSTSFTDLRDFFDPLVLRIQGAVKSGKVSWISLEFNRWTRLQELVLVDAFFPSSLWRNLCFGAWNRPGNGGAGGRGLRVIFDLSVKSGIEFVCSDLVDDAGGFGKRAASFIEEIVVHVCSEKQKVFLLDQVKASSFLPTTTVLVKSPDESKDSEKEVDATFTDPYEAFMLALQGLEPDGAR